jgi:prolyl 4-hydroxylase
MRTLLRTLPAGEVVVIDEFLPQPRLDIILEELQFAYWSVTKVTWQSSSGSLHQGTSVGRRSETTFEDWFSPELLREVALLEARICQMLGLSRSYLEHWQATRYRRGGYFDEHLDSRLADRVVTLLLYLNTPEQGGNTVFPELALDIGANAGRLVAWMNLSPDGHVNPAMKHMAQPVKRGCKMILTTWSRRRPIRLDTASDRKE